MLSFLKQKYTKQPIMELCKQLKNTFTVVIRYKKGSHH